MNYLIICVFFFKQKTAYEMLRSLVGSEMCIRDRDDALLVEIRLSARLVRHVITCLLNIWLIFWLSVSAV